MNSIQQTYLATQYRQDRRKMALPNFQCEGLGTVVRYSPSQPGATYEKMPSMLTSTFVDPSWR